MADPATFLALNCVLVIFLLWSVVEKNIYIFLSLHYHLMNVVNNNISPNLCSAPLTFCQVFDQTALQLAGLS